MNSEIVSVSESIYAYEMHNSFTTAAATQSLSLQRLLLWKRTTQLVTKKKLGICFLRHGQILIFVMNYGSSI